MTLPPCVIVHSLAQAKAALAPGLPVTLLSGEGAGAYAGAGWWLALMQAAAAAPPPHLLDCGTAPGRALEALRAGQPRLILRAPAAIFAEVAAQAASHHALLLPAAPPSLDLSHRHAARALIAWLDQAMPA